MAVQLDIPEIQGIVAGDAKVSAGSGDSSKVTFTGNEPIAFGFQAFVMLFDENVSLGVERTRGRDRGARAWTADSELASVRDRSLPDD